MQSATYILLNGMLLHSLVFICAKILTRDWKLRAVENIYIIPATLLSVIIVDVVVLFFAVGFIVHNLLSVVYAFIVFFYFRKIKSYSSKKSSALTLFSKMIAGGSNLFVLTITNILFPGYLEIDLSASHHDYFYQFIRDIPFLLANGIVIVLNTFLFIKLTAKLRERVNQNNKVQTVLAIISIFILVVMQLSTSIIQFQNEFIAYITSWEIFFLFGFSVTVFVSFYFYTRALRERGALQQKEAEQEALQYYTQQIEQQQTILRQFKHDQQNILLSMEGYLETDNLPGLKKYFYENIKTTTELITNDSFTLDRLSNIAVPEIKAILASKLMVAQSIGIDIAFEANDKISHVPVNSVALVRMLGIIMDNAIEELETIGQGQLTVACYKTESSATFIVQNACRPDIQKLHQLEQVGFSTKGEGRGLGLSNLTAIAAAYPDNITLHTSIEDGNFTQMIQIGDAR